MADDQPNPLLRLLPPRTLARKKRKPTFPPPPDRVARQHGRSLRDGAEQIRQHFQQSASRLPQLVTDVPYVRVELAEKAIASDDELKSIGLVPVFRRQDAVLAAYAPEPDLRRLEEQIDSYSREKKKLAVLAKIGALKPWTRADRTSDRIQALGELVPDREYTVDVLLLPIEGQPSNPQALPKIDRFVTSRHGRILDRADESTFTAFRVRLGGQALDDLLEYRDDVALVDLPPEAHVLVPQVMSLDLNSLPEIAAPPATAPAICVVDSGILEGHPLLEGAVLSKWSRSFPESLGPPVPRRRSIRRHTEPESRASRSTETLVLRRSRRSSRKKSGSSTRGFSTMKPGWIQTGCPS